MVQHLTRQQARELPSFIDSPKFEPAIGLCLAETLWFTIQRDGKPVTSFVPGWRPSSISALFYPLLILEFRHANNDSAYWLLDNKFTYLTSAFEQLPANVKTFIGFRAKSIAIFLEGTDGSEIPHRCPDDVRSFLELSPASRRDILECFGLTGAENQPEATEQGFLCEVETDSAGLHRHVGVERAHELLAHGDPIVLLPGWRIRSLSSLFFPVFVADLQHDDGHAAYWFFDRHGNYLVDRWDRLPESAGLIVAAHSAMILEDLWQDIVAGPGDRTRDHVEAFLALPLVTRNAIFDLHHSPARPEHQTTTWTLTEPVSATMGHVAQTELGPVLLDPGHTQRLLQRDLQGQNIALVNEGAVSWPSPLDGRELPASGAALLLDNLCFAYRVQDPEAGLTFYLIALGGHFRLFALYFPQNDLLVARDAHQLDGALRYQTRYRLLLLRHAVHRGQSMLAGAGKPPGEIHHTFRGHPAILIGHFIWQDLSGVHSLLAGTKPDRVPRFLVPETHLQPEIFGPIDTIFPALKGRVVRTDDIFDALVPGLYEANARVIKATGMHVPRAIGTSVLAGYKASPANRRLLTRCRNLSRECDILVLVGLRVGNRTIIDIAAFATRIISAIADEFPKAGIILDGQNASGQYVYDCFGDNQAAPDSFLRQELDIAAALSRHAAARGITLINNVGRPMVESLLWCEAADFFVAPWGAALAKYRWICNKPGLVLTGRWNLLHRGDLPIYHGPAYNQDPSEMWFNDPDTAEDAVGPDETEVTLLERSNFSLDAAAVEAQLIALLRDRLKLRARPPEPEAPSAMLRRRIGG